MSLFEDKYWLSTDGLKLHYRDYAGGEGRPVVLCLPGLIGNAREFEELASRLAGQWRVICPEMRGRGDSAYAKDASSYHRKQYDEDLHRLIDAVGIERMVVIGTSLGALSAMAFFASCKDKIAGFAINDMGPVVKAAGLERLRGNVGQGRNFPTWMHAARALEDMYGDVFPDYQVNDWLVAAKRSMALGANGRIVFDYDMKIAEAFSESTTMPFPDLWPILQRMPDIPVLLIRGELSDILSIETFVNMRSILPQSEAITVPRVGHSPSLDEPVCVAAIDRLLARVAKS